MITSSTLRPGLLVNLKTSVTGNVQYNKVDIEPEYLTKDGQRKARWETERTISDPAEHEASAKVRGRCTTLIRSVCAKSAFGLLCPDDKVDFLEQAMIDARAICEGFNKKAKLTRINVYVMTGRIAPDDVEAVRAINSEVRELLEEMTQGVKKLDVQAVRDADVRARSVGQMLSQDAQVRLQFAIDAARDTATRIKAAGEQAAVEIDKATLRRIAESRTAFLDLDEAKPVAKPRARVRAVDHGPSTPVKVVRKAKAAPLFEME